MDLILDDVSWCLRTLPKAVFSLLKETPGLVLAGGYVRSRVAGEKPNDIDLFAAGAEQAKAAADALAKDTKAIFTSDNAYTVRGFGLPVQVVHRWTYANPQDVLQSFDFTIARAAVWHDTVGQAWHGECDPRFYADLAARRLRYCSPVRNEDAGGSLLRVLKFYQRGYRIPIDSLGAVIARLVQGVKIDEIGDRGEEQWAKVLTGLLREVDPNVDPTHNAHLPSSAESQETP